jgi:hypothetical protein
MLCEAVLESDGPNRVEARLAGKGRGQGLLQSTPGQRSLRKSAVRPVIQSEVFSHGRFRNQKIKPSSKRDENMNLFAWTCV